MRRVACYLFATAFIFGAADTAAAEDFERRIHEVEVRFAACCPGESGPDYLAQLHNEVVRLTRTAEGLSGGASWVDLERLHSVRTAVEVLEPRLRPVTASTTGQTVSGSVRDEATGAPLENIGVVLFDQLRQEKGTGTTDSGGLYSIAVGPGTYFARTFNTQTYINESYDNRVCLACDVTGGNPISVEPGKSVSGINFALVKGGQISGRVTDGRTGDPINSPMVTIYDESGSFAAVGMSRSDGTYRTDAGLPTGTYFAVVDYVPNFLSQRFDRLDCDPTRKCPPAGATPIAVSAGIARENINFPLRPLPRISGRVTSRMTGQPLARVWVNFRDESKPSSPTAITGADGEFSVPAAPGTYYGIASPQVGENYFSLLYKDFPCGEGIVCDHTQGLPISVGFDDVGRIDFALRSTVGRVTGRVIDAATGSPLANATVFLYQPGRFQTQVRTHANGEYVADQGLRTGSYYARAEASNVDPEYLARVYGAPSCAECDAVTGTEIAVTADQITKDINFALERSGVISGRIVDAVTGAPIHHAAVLAIESTSKFGWTYATTDAAGYYEIRRGLAGRDYFVAAHASRYVSQLYKDVARHCWIGIGCDTSGATPIPVKPAQTSGGVDFALRKSGVIRGRVTDEVTGAPIERAVVRVYDSSGFFVAGEPTDSLGQYVIPGEHGKGLFAGKYFVTAVADRYQGEIYSNVPCSSNSPCNDSYLANLTGTPVGVADGESTTVDFALRTRGAYVLGTVTDARTSAALAGVTVEYSAVLQAGGAQAGSVTTDAGGRYLISGPLGTYRLRTRNTLGYVDQAYGGVWCGPCDPASGAPVFIGSEGQTRSAVDFGLAKIVATAINPAAGTTTGGEEATITGFGFAPTAQVTIGGAAGRVLSGSSEQIRIITPPGASGMADVVVTNPSGDSAVVADGFRYFVRANLEISVAQNLPTLTTGAERQLVLRIHPATPEATHLQIDVSRAGIVSVPAQLFVPSGVSEVNVPLRALSPGEVLVTATLPENLGGRAATALVKVTAVRRRGAR